MSSEADEFDRERVERYVANNPHATPLDVLAQLGLAPGYLEHVAAIVDGENPPDVVPSETDDDAPEYPAVDLDDVAEHYARLGDLYAELGTIDGDVLAAGVTGRKGWYKSREHAGEEWTARPGK